MGQVIDRYEVDVKVVVRTGGQYFIAPSEGFPAIEPGPIMVVNMVESSAVDADTKDAWMAGLDEVDDNDIATEWLSKPWVEFRYTLHQAENDIMPLDMFAVHVVSRY